MEATFGGARCIQGAPRLAAHMSAAESGPGACAARADGIEIFFFDLQICARMHATFKKTGRGDTLQGAVQLNIPIRTFNSRIVNSKRPGDSTVTDRLDGIGLVCGMPPLDSRHRGSCEYAYKTVQIPCVIMP